MNLDGHNLEDLPGTFDCDVFVPGASMTAMREAGVPMDGFIDNAEGKAARSGRRSVHAACCSEGPATTPTAS
jgi:hypothetical protein